VQQGQVVVMDHRTPLPDAIDPHAGLVHRIVRAFPFGMAEFPERPCTPGLQRQGLLVRLEEVIEPDRASGQVPHFVEGRLEKLLGRVVSRKIRQPEASGPDFFCKTPLGDILEHAQQPGDVAAGVTVGHFDDADPLASRHGTCPAD
jgi:hypothetical protein